MDEAACWREIDKMWDGYIRGRTTVTDPTLPMHEDWGVDWWNEVDVWWEGYADSQREYLIELTNLVDCANKEWQESGCRFSRDPLTTDWRHTTASAGPLRTNQEENWSQWLAHLLRSSSGELISRLLGDGFEESPQTVRREVLFHSSNNKNRRIDVLAEYSGHGVSVEVKIDDENYRKTTHTAKLIEEQDYRSWQHILLLPKYKEPRLHATFGEQIEEDSGTVIRSSESEDIRILYWEDVALALRRMLLDEDGDGPHWEASAYLLVTLIEQRLRSFEPIEGDQEEGLDVVQSSELWALKSIDIADQIDYLKRLLRGDDIE